MASAISKTAAINQLVAALIPAQAGIDPKEMSELLAIAGKVLQDRTPDGNTLRASIGSGTQATAAALQKYAGNVRLEAKPAPTAKDVAETLGNQGKPVAVEAKDENASKG